MLRHERVRDRERIGRYRYVPMLGRPDGLRSHPVPVDADHDVLRMLDGEFKIFFALLFRRDLSLQNITEQLPFYDPAPVDHLVQFTHNSVYSGGKNLRVQFRPDEKRIHTQIKRSLCDGKILLRREQDHAHLRRQQPSPVQKRHLRHTWCLCIHDEQIWRLCRDRGDGSGLTRMLIDLGETLGLPIVEILRHMQILCISSKNENSKHICSPPFFCIS